MRTSWLFSLLLPIGLSGPVSAQSVTVAVAEIRHYDPYFADHAKAIHDFILRQVADNSAYTLVERGQFTALEAEKERQKNEGFIDGVIADQSRQLGAQRMVVPAYERDLSLFKVELVDLSSGEVYCTNRYDLAELMPNYRLSETFWQILRSDLRACLTENAPEREYQVIEVLEAKQDKAKKLLLYREGNDPLRPKDQLEVYRLLEKTVGGRVVPYPEVIGTVQVAEIENDQFFNALVKSGEQAIFQSIQEKVTLYARP
jgi:hypothetical protein